MTSRPDLRRMPQSGVVVPHRPNWQTEIAACAIWIGANALTSTLRLDIRDIGNIARDTPRPFIAALWHNRLALAMPIWKWWAGTHPGGGLAALISASRDGALLSRTFGYFGVKAVRGSSSRRGAQALRELLSAMDQGFNVAITPDGPRGPKYQVQPGIISLAQLSGAPIIPVGIQVSHKKPLRSWDAFQVPLPFAKCVVTLGAGLHVAREATPEQTEAARLALQSTLAELNGD